MEVDVRLVGVTKRFGHVVAVDDVSLEIEQGRFFSLLGPSGCGKTTTLRMLGGFEEPDAGVIELRGRNMAGIPPYKRNVNTVFQSYALFPHLDVYENVAYGLKRKKVPKDRVTRRVTDILRLVDLPGFEPRRPSQLSGGQQQRVALARALVNQPQVLLLDEPLGALDLKLRKQMQLELKRIQHEVGITFVYVTHDQEEAMTMSDAIAVMREGQIEQVGRPQDVYEYPSTEFVASFLGASNLLPGIVEGRDGEDAVVKLVSGEKVRVPSSRVPPGLRDANVGVRPEKIRILAKGAQPPNGHNAIAGRLQMATYIGVSNVYSVRARSGEEVTVYAQNLEVRGVGMLGEGEDILLAWHPEHTFVVEPSKGGSDG